jgi:hypothetical protein
MFDPKAHLIQLPRRVKNKATGQYVMVYDDYLEVKWRLVWFREKFPGGSIVGTTPFNRGEACDGLKKSESFGHPAGRDLPVLAKSRPEEANDEPADPILPQLCVPCERAERAGKHQRA